MKKQKSHYGKDFKDVIHDNGLRFEDVAKEIGISRKTLWIWFTKPISTIHQKKINHAIKTLVDRQEV